jgi:hypothetical protein
MSRVLNKVSMTQLLVYKNPTFSSHPPTMPSSILVFTNELLPSEKVDLGTLTYDIDTPWEDCCEDLDLQEDEVEIAEEPRLYDIIESGLSKGSALDLQFIKSCALLRVN